MIYIYIDSISFIWTDVPNSLSLPYVRDKTKIMVS